MFIYRRVAEAEQTAMQIVTVYERTEEHFQLCHTAGFGSVLVDELLFMVTHAVDDAVPTLLRRNPTVSVA